MAEDTYNIVVGSQADEKSAEQSGEALAKSVQKGIKKVLGNNGYIKLDKNIINHKYPKYDPEAITGPSTINYSKLQKAQDELISNWKKLSRKGFSSDDEKLLEVLKSYRKYNIEASSQYWRNSSAEVSDKTLMKIRETIGTQLARYFGRLVKGTKEEPFSFFKSGINDKVFEDYAKTAIHKFRAAQMVGVDLSQKNLAPDAMSKINKKLVELAKLEQEEYGKQLVKQRKKDYRNRKKIQAEQEAEVAKIRQEREEEAKNAIPIPEFTVEGVNFVESEERKPKKTKKHKRTRKDERSDEAFVEGLGEGAKSRNQGAPSHNKDDVPYSKGNDIIPLGIRQQMWNPAYLTEEFLRRMERGGTYVDTNSLLRQIAQALPEELKKAQESLVVKIDKDAVAAEFNKLDEQTNKEFTKLENQLGISKLLLTNVAKVQGGLMAGRADVTADDLKQAIAVALSDALEHGTSPILAENYNKAITSITNMLMARYSNMRDKFGTNLRRYHKKTDTMDEEIGVGINYEEVAKTLKEVFGEFEKASKMLMGRAVKEYPEYYNDESFLPKQKNTMFNQVFAAKLSSSMDVMRTYLGDAAEGLASLLTVTKLGDTSQLVAEDRQEQILEEDKDSGANTDEFSNKNLSNQRTNIDVTKTIYKVLQSLYSAFQSCPCQEILTAILQTVQEIKTGGVRVKGKVKEEPQNEEELQKEENKVVDVKDDDTRSVPDVIRDETGKPVDQDTVSKSFLTDILRAKNIFGGIKKPTEILDLERLKRLPEFLQSMLTRRRKEQAETETPLPNWRQVEMRAEKDAAEAKELEEQRKRLTEQLKYEAEEAQKRNKNKAQPISPRIIEAPGKDINQMAAIGIGLKRMFQNLFSGSEVERTMKLSEGDREREAARRRELYGETRGNGSLSDTGVIANMKYMRNLWRGEDQDTVRQKIRKTDDIDNIDTTKLMAETQKALQNGMFNAQTGGILRNLVGSMSFYIGQPSIEKSRAEAEGLNQAIADVRNKALSLLEKIQGNQGILREMEQDKLIEYNDDGTIKRDISTGKVASKTFADLEQQKDTFRSLQAEMKNIDKVTKQWGGNVHQILKHLSFMMPELRDENVIIQNINAGLNKNGKALKFQTRTAEILKYTFDLMARHIGQMWKRWMLQLNPITQIRKAFKDFMSYDVKWKRTMNVIKYNFRRVIRPFMEWIAQQLVNIIGLANAFLKGIGKAVGKDWDLFDKDAANTEKMREDLEAMQSITAGFDELHDIGSNNGAENNLFGDIYTPQWEDLNNIFENAGKNIANFGKNIQDMFDGIKNAVKDWNFWNWLILAGAALAGFLVLKGLFDLLRGKNPLQTVANGFVFLEKAVGWAVLIWAFTAFTRALTDFIKVVGEMNPTDVWRAFGVLAASFALLVGAISILMFVAKKLGTDFLTLLGLSAVVAAFTLLAVALTYFINAISKIEQDKINDVLKVLVISLGAVTLCIAALIAVLGAAIASGVGAAAVAALALVLVTVAAVIASLALLVVALGEYSDEIIAIMDKVKELMQAWGDIIVQIIFAIGLAVTTVVFAIGETIMNIINTITQGVKEVVQTIGDILINLVTIIGNTIVMIVQTTEASIINVIQAIANVVKSIIEPIMEFINNLIDKIIELAHTIVHEVGEVIKDIITTIGDVIVKVINTIVDAISKLLNTILDFIRQIGPAIETSADAILRTITKIINFTVSAVEYLINLVIDGVNDIINAINGVSKYVGITIPTVPSKTIRRFIPQYEQGTNYVPSDGLAYLHQGEAVIPKKYNQPYQQGLSQEERMYLQQMMGTMRSLDSTMKQGIAIKGEFRQRGSDLVATINKTNSQTGADLLSNVSYAR